MNQFGIFFEKEIREWFVKFLKYEGYDSAKFVEDHEFGGKKYDSETIVVFNPSKIVKQGQLELDLYENENNFPYDIKPSPDDPYEVADANIIECKNSSQFPN